jgi:hypothetical protein
MEPNTFEKLYGVFTRPQTYLNLLYLFLAFPFGLAYFILFTVGFSLGLGLMVVLVGFAILAGLFAAGWALTLFERQLAISLLGEKITPSTRTQQPGTSILQQLKNSLTDPVTWKGLAFLFLKFPIGVASFTVCVTLLSLSLGLLMAPLGYPWMHINLGFWRIDSMPAAGIAFVLGLIVTPLSLHATNIIASWEGAFARIMLGSPEPVQPAPMPVYVPPAADPTTPVQPSQTL